MKKLVFLFALIAFAGFGMKQASAQCGATDMVVKNTTLSCTVEVTIFYGTTPCNINGSVSGLVGPNSTVCFAIPSGDEAYEVEVLDTSTGDIVNVGYCIAAEELFSSSACPASVHFVSTTHTRIE